MNMAKNKQTKKVTMNIFPSDKEELKKISEKLGIAKLGDTEADVFHKLLEYVKRGKK